MFDYINQERLNTIFKEIASISSPSWKEEKVIAWIEKFCKKNKLDLEKIPCEQSFNLLIKIPATKEGAKRILFSAHTDTVTPCEGITVIETEKKFTSDGTTILGGDDKAGVAAILESLLALKESKVELPSIEVLLTCAEEVGLYGMKGMDMSRIEADYCFVLDSGGPIGSACIKAPYHSVMKVAITGKAAHAGMEPEHGLSAIGALARIIDALPMGRIDHETTTNVGTVRGGKATNIVAPDAYFDLEVRSIDKKKLREVEATIKSTIKEKAKEYGVKVKIEYELAYAGYSIKDKAPILSLFESACSLARLTPRYEASGGGSDTNILNAAKHKAINLSTGMAKVHTNAEYLNKSDLLKTAKLCVAIALSA